MRLSTKLKLIALRYNNFFQKRPLVLNLELTHACNLSCIHCGRIRDDVKGRLSAADAMRAIDTVAAPIVYFTGGEPFLLVRELAQCVNYALDKGKIVFVVTNGVLLPQLIDQFAVRRKDRLVLMFSVDGMKVANDRIRGEGTFEKIEAGIRVAKERGFPHRWMNFTVYSSNAGDFEAVVEHFRGQVENIHLNMYYDFIGNAPAFNERLSVIAQTAVALKRTYQNLFNPYLYFQIWEGIDVDCTPWGTVTRDASGWRSPCYFIDGGHFPTYDELMNKTQWKQYIKKQAKECARCMAHCGFEPTIYGKKYLLAKELLLRVKNAL